RRPRRRWLRCLMCTTLKAGQRGAAAAHSSQKKHALAKAPSLHRHYPASAVLRPSPPPQRARPVPRGRPVDHPDHALGLPVLRALSLCTCCRHYPGAAAGRSLRSCHPTVSAFPGRGRRVGLHIDLFEACSAFTRVAACTLARSPIRDPLSEGFRHFVASMPAPVASGWSESPGGACTHWKAPPCHGAPPLRPLPEGGLIPL